MKKSIFIIIKIIIALIICAAGIGAPLHALAAPSALTATTNFATAPDWWTQGSTLSGKIYATSDTVGIPSVNCTGGTVTSNTWADAWHVETSITISGEGIHAINCNYFWWYIDFVVQIDSVPPTITYTGRTPPANGAGWNNTDVDVNWLCNDATSGVVSTTVTRTVTTEGKNQSVTGTCIDNAGKTASNTVSGINIDKTGPAGVVLTPNGTLGNNGWYISDINITTTGFENFSTPITCTDKQSQTHDTPGIGFEGSCINAANLHTFASPVVVKRDATPPIITYVDRTPTNAAGWNNIDVTVNWDCSDATSGPVSETVSQTVTAEGNNQSVTGTCTDNAGNTASNTVTGINIDRTPPTNIFGAPNLTPTKYGWNNKQMNIVFNGTDALSGIDTCTTVLFKGPDTDTAGITVPGNCTDLAGNQSDTYNSKTIKYDTVPPTGVVVTLSPSLNSGGWYNTNVTPKVTCADGLSGIDIRSSDPPVITTEGMGQMSVGFCVDQAGNETRAAPVSVNIDKTPPKIEFLGPVPDANGFTGPVTFRWLCSDPLSGVVAQESNQTISKEGQGQSATGTCKDMAGNVSSNTVNGINIKFDSSQGTSGNAGSGIQSPGEGTQGAENSNSANPLRNLDFRILYYILGGVVFALLIGWLVFFLKKK
jgi:hypothetical protein